VAVLTWDNAQPWDGPQTWDGFLADVEGHTCVLRPLSGSVRPAVEVSRLVSAVPFDNACAGG
jgi:hypothetical protein